MIEVTCKTCGTILQIPDQYRGTTGQCNQCGHTVAVPAQARLKPVPKWKLSMLNGCALIAVSIGALAVISNAVAPNPPTPKPPPVAAAPLPFEEVQAPPEPEPKSLSDKLADVFPGPLTVAEHEPSDHVLIRFTARDNLTKSLTVSASKIHTLKLLEVAHAERPGYAVTISIFAPMVDRYGNSSESSVVGAMYSVETLRKINFDGINHDNAWAIADESTIHREFRQ